MPDAPFSVRTLAGSAVVHVAFAFLAMGSWAAFANHEHGWSAALLAGVVQGALSGAITLSLKKGVDFLMDRFAGLAALIAPPLIACSISLSVLVAAHWVAGTPEIVATIAFPFSVAFTYACVYSVLRWRARRLSS